MHILDFDGVPQATTRKKFQHV